MEQSQGKGEGMKRFYLVLFALVLACAGGTAFAQSERSAIEALPWQVGPTTVKLGDRASLNVLDGYQFLDPAGTRSFNNIVHNPPANGDQYILAPKSLHWVAFFAYEDIG